MTSTPTVVIGFSGETTIRQANEIAERLKHALASSDRVEVDCSGVTETDITFIQMMVAAHKSALAAGKVIELSAPARGPLLEAVTLCGAENGPRSHFWFEGRTS